MLIILLGPDQSGSANVLIEANCAIAHSSLVCRSAPSKKSETVPGVVTPNQVPVCKKPGGADNKGGGGTRGEGLQRISEIAESRVSKIAYNSR